MRRIAIAALILTAYGISACGGSETVTPPPANPVSVSVASPTATIAAGGTYQFTSTVSGSTNTAVTWSVDVITGTNVGAISSSGLYTAPNASGTFTVRATSAADPTKNGSATITVSPPPIALTITPANTFVGPGGSVLLTASVTGATNTAVTWELPAGANTGTIVVTGPANATYTAPNRFDNGYPVRATSVADPSKSAIAVISVEPGSGFRIAGPDRVAPGASTQFTALFNDVARTATWSIDGAASGSTVSATGVFTAGATEATITLRATDALSRTATTLVRVGAQVTLEINVPTNPTLTTADMLTFYWQVRPTGVSSDVNWSVLAANNGTTVAVDYFRGFIPTQLPGVVSITGTTVADPTVKAGFNATIIAAPGNPFLATTGLPQSSRYEHTAATLTDGRVVLIGGQRSRGPYAPLTSTEVFNPATGTFAVGPTLKSSRMNAEAVALNANQVLVTGGREEYNLAYNTGEVIDIATGSSTAVLNTMGARRNFHQMIALTTGPNAGRVAILGGFNGPIPYGDPTWQSTTLVEIFDPATNRFSAYSAAMRSPRGLFTATTLADGKVLLTGGYVANTSTRLASAEIFDPVAGTFTFTGSMSKARSGHTATRLQNGTVLIVGGTTDGNDGATAEIYNPTTGQFESVNGTMSVTRRDHAAAILGDGRVAIIGGESAENWVRGTVEVYDPNSRTFSALGYMTAARRRPTASVITGGPNAGRILVFGGGAEDKINLTAEIVR